MGSPWHERRVKLVSLKGARWAGDLCCGLAMFTDVAADELASARKKNPHRRVSAKAMNPIPKSLSRKSSTRNPETPNASIPAPVELQIPETRNPERRRNTETPNRFVLPPCRNIPRVERPELIRKSFKGSCQEGLYTELSLWHLGA